MGLAKYDIYEQRKCFMLNYAKCFRLNYAKFDIACNSDIKTCSSIIFHSTLYSSKNVSFWPACSGRCGQIKSFGVKHCIVKTGENKLIWLISLHYS